ncbi:hypothetical protein BDK51DRAFT_45609 [Blyttiomyces helicus]|uniref:Uncharacterized protein n=1 Tax=Blyttiomyces helicus TaxID=388810 RepID=A0A4P9WKB1_9FUNG|nr:hypothetical protein BDK51DRAFT_45609 [Blyttiomyces helicus]|eukprot:RKO93419.1 hypothetical protein BDK51DRAFT_45609 [Blyttiomyces helicus]
MKSEENEPEVLAVPETAADYEVEAPFTAQDLPPAHSMDFEVIVDATLNDSLFASAARTKTHFPLLPCHYQVDAAETDVDDPITQAVDADEIEILIAVSDVAVIEEDDLVVPEDLESTVVAEPDVVEIVVSDVAVIEEDDPVVSEDLESTVVAEPEVVEIAVSDVVAIEEDDPVISENLESTIVAEPEVVEIAASAEPLQVPIPKDVEIGETLSGDLPAPFTPDYEIVASEDVGAPSVEDRALPVIEGFDAVKSSESLHAADVDLLENADAKDLDFVSEVAGELPETAVTGVVEASLMEAVMFEAVEGTAEAPLEFADAEAVEAAAADHPEATVIESIETDGELIAETIEVPVAKAVETPFAREVEAFVVEEGHAPIADTDEVETPIIEPIEPVSALPELKSEEKDTEVVAVPETATINEGEDTQDFPPAHATDFEVNVEENLGDAPFAPAARINSHDVRILSLYQVDAAGAVIEVDTAEEVDAPIAEAKDADDIGIGVSEVAVIEEDNLVVSEDFESTVVAELEVVEIAAAAAPLQFSIHEDVEIGEAVSGDLGAPLTSDHELFVAEGVGAPSVEDLAQPIVEGDDAVKGASPESLHAADIDLLEIADEKGLALVPEVAGELVEAAVVEEVEASVIEAIAFESFQRTSEGSLESPDTEKVEISEAAVIEPLETEGEVMTETIEVPAAEEVEVFVVEVDAPIADTDEAEALIIEPIEPLSALPELKGEVTDTEALAIPETATGVENRAPFTDAQNLLPAHATDFQVDPAGADIEMNPAEEVDAPAETICADEIEIPITASHLAFIKEGDPVVSEDLESTVVAEPEVVDIAAAEPLQVSIVEDVEIGEAISGDLDAPPNSDHEIAAAADVGAAVAQAHGLPIIEGVEAVENASSETLQAADTDLLETADAKEFELIPEVAGELPDATVIEEVEATFVEAVAFEAVECATEVTFVSADAEEVKTAVADHPEAAVIESLEADSELMIEQIEVPASEAAEIPFAEKVPALVVAEAHALVADEVEAPVIEPIETFSALLELRSEENETGVLETATDFEAEAPSTHAQDLPPAHATNFEVNTAFIKEEDPAVSEDFESTVIAEPEVFEITATEPLEVPIAGEVKEVEDIVGGPNAPLEEVSEYETVPGEDIAAAVADDLELPIIEEVATTAASESLLAAYIEVVEKMDAPVVELGLEVPGELPEGAVAEDLKAADVEVVSSVEIGCATEEPLEFVGVRDVETAAAEESEKASIFELLEAAIKSIDVSSLESLQIAATEEDRPAEPAAGLFLADGDRELPDVVPSASILEGDADISADGARNEEDEWVQVQSSGPPIEPSLTEASIEGLSSAVPTTDLSSGATHDLTEVEVVSVISSGVSVPENETPALGQSGISIAGENYEVEVPEINYTEDGPRDEETTASSSVEDSGVALPAELPVVTSRELPAVELSTPDHLPSDVVLVDVVPIVAVTGALESKELIIRSIIAKCERYIKVINIDAAVVSSRLPILYSAPLAAKLVAEWDALVLAAADFTPAYDALLRARTACCDVLDPWIPPTPELSSLVAALSH